MKFFQKIALSVPLFFLFECAWLYSRILYASVTEWWNKVFKTLNKDWCDRLQPACDPYEAISKEE